MVEDAVVREATRRLVEEMKPSRVYLFGSRARDDAASESDYDFLVVMPASSERHLSRTRRAYRSLRGMDIAKDIVVTTSDRFERMSSVASSLEHEVASEGLLLYG